MRRKKGYYWVWIDAEWHVALYTGKDRWIYADCPQPFSTDDFEKIGGHCTPPIDSVEGNRVLYVGELKALLANVDDKLPLAARGHNGGEWKSGFDIGMIVLETLGRGADKMTVRAGDVFWKSFKGKRSKSFDAVALD